MDFNLVKWKSTFQELLGRTPNREDCDAVSTEVPVICWRRCYHIVVANSKALEGSSTRFNRIVPDHASGTHSSTCYHTLTACYNLPQSRGTDLISS